MELSYSVLFCVILTAIFSPVVQSQNCNICGDGNSIQYPQGVVEFVYDGVERKNNCETWQDIVKNPVAISDDFCRNEMIKYTAVPCRCTTPAGDSAAASMKPPTKSPAPTPATAGGSAVVDSAPSSAAVSAPSSAAVSAPTGRKPESNSGSVSRCEQLSNSTARCNDTPSSSSSAESLQPSVEIWILLCSALVAFVAAV
jgi:hypothetical protein